ncbi:MAG: sulfotransferase [Pseudomonadota bacterium]
MPDVFILGYTKCATTSLYNQLMQHEGVSRMKHKEPHFHFVQVLGDRFDGPADKDIVEQMFVTEPDQYQALYEPGKLTIDGSAMSIEDPRILKLMNEQYPSAKFVIMLRNPLERAFSAYSHLIRDARETLSFTEAIEEELSGARSAHLPIWHNVKSSRYVYAIQHARQLLGDRLKVVSFDDYARNNQQTMDEVAAFIGLSPMTWQREVANRSGIPRSKSLQKMIMRKSLAKSLFVKALPETWVTRAKRALLERNTGAKLRITEPEREYFKSVIADEAAKIHNHTVDSALLRSLYQ